MFNNELSKEQFVDGIVQLSLKNIDEEVPEFTKGFIASNFKGKAAVNIYLTTLQMATPPDVMYAFASEMATKRLPKIEKKLAKDYPEIIFSNPRLFLSLYEPDSQYWDINLMVTVERKK